MATNELRKALVIGVESYPEGTLPYCINDAEELAAALEMPEYGFQVNRLIDKDGHKKAIRKELDLLFSGDPSMVLFYFAGHGYLNDLGLYLLSIDGDEYDPGLDIELLKRLVRARAPEDCNVIVILDCCHAGAAQLRDLAKGPANRSCPSIEAKLPVLGDGRVILAACASSGAARGKEVYGHGIFTFHLLQGMLGAAANEHGITTISGLYEHVCRQMQGKEAQVPVFRGDQIGTITMGEGLPSAVESKLDEETFQAMVSKAERLSGSFQDSFAESYSNAASFREAGYKHACASLTPVQEWFEEKVLANPELKMIPRFKKAQETIDSTRSLLGNVSEGFAVGRGVIVRRLGSGTFGSVWCLARDSHGKATEALKIYHPQDLHLREKRERFLRGFKAMQQLDHEHIVKVFEATTCPLAFYMTFIDGPNMRQFVGTTTDVGEMLNILLTIAETIKHAHSRGVIHRDIKPENIVLQYDEAHEQWKPYLTDFDLAWFSTASVLTTEALGTVYYAAPEQLSKPGSAAAHTNTVDVFSFGQLCFYALTNSDPTPLSMADNKKLLEKALGIWPGEEGAREFMSLYNDMAEVEPGRRVGDFREICDRLYHTRIGIGMRAARGQEEAYPRPDFMKELLFSIIGLSPDRMRGENSFATASGRTEVCVNIEETTTEGANFVIGWNPQFGLSFSGKTDYRKARQILWQQIDEAISGYANAKRMPDPAGGLHFAVKITALPLNNATIEIIRGVVTRVIDVIERQ